MGAAGRGACWLADGGAPVLGNGDGTGSGTFCATAIVGIASRTIPSTAGSRIFGPAMSCSASAPGAVIAHLRRSLWRFRGSRKAATNPNRPHRSLVFIVLLGANQNLALTGVVGLADDAFLDPDNFLDNESRSMLFHGWHAGIECRR